MLITRVVLRITCEAKENGAELSTEGLRRLAVVRESESLSELSSSVTSVGASPLLRRLASLSVVLKSETV